jgi:uncharacterized protein
MPPGIICKFSLCCLTFALVFGGSIQLLGIFNNALNENLKKISYSAINKLKFFVKTDMNYPLMPKATAVWLLENTGLTFDQIADFCGLHVLEVHGIADGEVAKGIRGVNPITHGQITSDEISRCEEDSSARLKLSASAVKLMKEQEVNNKKSKYIPVARRQDKPNAIAWILKNCPEITDAQISKLIGTTKNTINLIRNKTHWNYSNLRAKDPVLLGLCTQADLNYVSELAKQKLEARKNN